MFSINAVIVNIGTGRAKETEAEFHQLHFAFPFARENSPKEEVKAVPLNFAQTLVTDSVILLQVLFGMTS